MAILLHGAVIATVLHLLLPSAAFPTSSNSSELAMGAPSEDGIKIVSGIKCHSTPGPEQPSAYPCELAIHELEDDYGDFGEIEWGEGAPVSRKFPFIKRYGNCEILINSYKPEADDKFSIEDIQTPLIDIFLDCFAGGKPPPAGEYWSGGMLRFLKHGSYPLNLKLQFVGSGTQLALDDGSLSNATFA